MTRSRRMQRLRSRWQIFIKGRRLRVVGRQREMTVMIEIAVGVSKALNLLLAAGKSTVKATRFVFLREGKENTVNNSSASKVLVVHGAVDLIPHDEQPKQNRATVQIRKLTLPSLLSCSIRRATASRGIWQLAAMSATDMPVEGSPRSLTI